MAIEIAAVGEGFVVTVSPPHGEAWTSHASLDAAEVLAACARLGCHSMDVTDALDAAGAEWRPKLRADLSRFMNRTVRWRPTGDAFFPWAARVRKVWWVLRVNSFPDHPIYTLFVGGARRGDVEEVPRRWLQFHRFRLTDPERAGALEGIRSFVAYGSEVGQPCDNPFCCG